MLNGGVVDGWASVESLYWMPLTYLHTSRKFGHSRRIHGFSGALCTFAHCTIQIRKKKKKLCFFKSEFDNQLVGKLTS